MKNKMKGKPAFKHWMGKIHLWLGLASGLVVVVVSITGCLFVFEQEIRQAIHQKRQQVPVQAQQSFISVQQFETSAKGQLAGHQVKQLRIYNQPGRAWEAVLGKDKRASFNPYNGQLIATYSQKDWLTVVEQIHKSLLLGNVGKWIIRVNVVIFLVLLLSGLVLWWPANAARRKQSFRIKWKASAKRVNYDFHNVIGFYSGAILLLITFTGLYMSFDGVKKATYFLTGSRYQKPQPEKIKESSGQLVHTAFSPARAIQMAMATYPGAYEVHLNYPAKPNEPVKVKMHYASNTYKKVNELHYHPITGQTLYSNLFSNYSTGDKWKHSNRDLHTGAFFGLTGKILAFLASLLAASMPVTGFAIWWGRTKKKKIPKKSAPIKAGNVGANALA